MNDNQPITRIAYSPQEAAAALGVSRSFIYKLLEDGTIRSFKLGRSRRITHDELLRVTGADQ